MGATLSLAHRGSLDPDHILYGLLNGSSDTRQVRLRPRRPFMPAVRNRLDNLARLGIGASEWTNHKWKTEYCENASRLRAFMPWTGTKPVLRWAYPEQLGLSSTACGLVLGDSIRPCTNGSCSFTELRVWRLWANRRPCSNSVPYTSGTTWNTRSDGFGWRNSMLV